MIQQSIMHLYNTTSRLVLRPIELGDAAFLISLMNSKGWLRFIGDRKISNEQDAKVYIQNILKDDTFFYHVIELKISKQPIGIISFLQRKKMPYPDIGFALLPKFEKMGYAMEATQSYLNSVVATKSYSNIIAIAMKENQKSIRLLQKLEFSLLGQTEVEGDTIAYYGLKPCKPFW